jgi:hypothetical protein
LTYAHHTTFSQGKRLRAIALVAGSIGMAAASSAAHAALVTYGFGCISSNVANACSTGQAQLMVDVTNDNGVFSGLTLASNQALFVFRNTGPAMSSITDVYFDDGTLLGIATLWNTAGMVEFSPLASPGNLPGGNTVNFVTTAGFSADSDPPVQPNGVNPGERLGVVFNLINGTSFGDLLAAIDGGSALRIGIHAQGFANGQSAAFVNEPTPVTAVPLPAAGWLLAGGLVALTRRRRAATARSD